MVRTRRRGVWIFLFTPRRGRIWDCCRAAVSSDPLQVGPHIGGRLVTHLPVFFEQPSDNLFQVGGEFRIPLEQRDGSIIQNGRKYRGGCWSVERPDATGQLVEHYPERPEIRTRIYCFAARLLWRHVRRGPDCLSGFGNARRPCRGIAWNRDTHRNTEVQNLYLAIQTNENVSWFQVPVDDSRCMSRSQTTGNLLRKIQQFPDIIYRTDGPTFDILHYEVVGTDVEQGADVRMIERR